MFKSPSVFREGVARMRTSSAIGYSAAITSVTRLSKRKPRSDEVPSTMTHRPRAPRSTSAFRRIIISSYLIKRACSRTCTPYLGVTELRVSLPNVRILPPPPPLRGPVVRRPCALPPSALALPARPRRDLRGGVRGALVPDPGPDWPERHSAGGGVFTRGKRGGRREGVLADSDAALGGRGAGGGHGAGPRRPRGLGRHRAQPLAARRDRRRVARVALLRHGGAGVLGVSERLDAARGGVSLALSRAARGAAGDGLARSADAGGGVSAAVAVVPDLLRVGARQDPQRGGAVAEPDGDGPVLRERAAADVDRVVRAAAAARVSCGDGAGDAARRAVRGLARVCAAAGAGCGVLHHRAAAGRDHPHRELRVSELPGAGARTDAARGGAPHPA